LTCSSSAISATSSISSALCPSIDPSAPALSRIAPVKAPFTCPNISDSTSVGANAERLTTWYALAWDANASFASSKGRYPARPMASAATSFPAPVGPRMSVEMRRTRAQSPST
jgi:hypothetical protein